MEKNGNTWAPGDAVVYRGTACTKIASPNDRGEVLEAFPDTGQVLVKFAYGTQLVALNDLERG